MSSRPRRPRPPAPTRPPARPPAPAARPPPPPRRTDSVESRRMLMHPPREWIRGKRGGLAVDVVCVIAKDFARSTPFKVRFGGSSKKKFHDNDPVLVYLNGKLSFEMRLNSSDGYCFFPQNASKTPPAGLLDDFLKGVTSKFMHVRFEHVCRESEVPLRFAECSLWLFGVDESIVVSDVDGTITKSDVSGLWNTVVRMKAGYKHSGYAHEGVCGLLRRLSEFENVTVMYLTARPIDLIEETKTYVRTLKDENSVSLPLGPVVSDTTNYAGSIRRELIDRSSHKHKIEVLSRIKSCFRSAGRDVVRYPVFPAGFGNKGTDSAAYDRVGVPHVSIVEIDSNSNVRLNAGLAHVLEDGYASVTLWKWLCEMMTLALKGNLPQPDRP